MKNTPFLLVSCLLFYPSQLLLAQSRQKAIIEQATVFLRGAELVSTAKVNIPSGESEVLFTNIAGNVNEQSISISSDKDLAVQSATFQNDYLEPESVTPRAKEIKDSIEKVKDDTEAISNHISLINEEITIIRENHKISGNNNGLSVAELQKMLDFVNVKKAKLLEDRSKLKARMQKANELLARLQKQYDEEQKKGVQPGGQLLVKFYSKESLAANIHISYLVPNAGWTPSYDLRVSDINSPVSLLYKANVFQNSGVKWNNVKLVLSTGNPAEGGQAPALSPWYLGFYEPRVYKTMRAEPAADRMGVSSAPANNMATMNEYVSVDNSGINTTFDIDIPYSIPNDGQHHIVSIKTYQLPATYRYYVVPKIDKDVFLQAQVTNWEDLNLVPGKTNIFYEGSYVGQGNIDMRGTSDTMTLSLGRDKKIIVKRDKDVDFHSKKMIGTNVSEASAYSISLRNTRKQPIELTVLDQVPVSNDKDIVIDDKQTGGAQYDETTGELKWILKLEANESKKLKFGYTVKYPKGKTINNLR